MLALLALLVSGILFASLSQANLVTIRANAGCSFHLSTGGASALWVGQLPNGQARAGSTIQSSTFTWFGDAFVDQQERGCWWTPPTNVLQCDVNQQPSHGFGIGCDGTVTYNGQSTFYSCSTGDGDQVNIYLQNGPQCQAITLFSDGCKSCSNSSPPPSGPQPATTSNASSSQPSTPTITPFTTNPGQVTTSIPSSSRGPSGTAKPQPTTLPSPAKDCPADLSGSYEYPRLLVPIDMANPDRAYGSTFYGQVSPNASTIFNFVFPASDIGKSCKAFFSFPTKSQLQSSDYYFTGDGPVTFSRLSIIGDLNTTYNSVVGTAKELGTLKLVPGNTYVIETFDCPAGQSIAYLASEAQGKNTCLVYFQDYNPSEIGMFISTC